MVLSTDVDIASLARRAARDVPRNRRAPANPIWRYRVLIRNDFDDESHVW